jgi:serine/threonine-protein kinase RsbW
MARLLGHWAEGESRAAFRLHRVLKLNARRSQHFQQIRHPARPMILDQTLELKDLIQSAIWHEPCFSTGVMAQKFQMEIAAMAHTQSLSLLPRNGHSGPFIELRQSLPSKVAVIAPFADQLMHFILKFRSTDGTEADIEMALHEALANAVIHGNGENSCKRIYVEFRCYMDGEVSITVRDEGRGFDSSAVPDPTFLENLLFTHGRGIYLIKTLMDEVSFEKGGAVVIMRKKSNANSAEQRKPS